MSVFKRRKPEDAAPAAAPGPAKPEPMIGYGRPSGGYDIADPEAAGVAASGLGVPPFRPAPAPSGAAFGHTASKETLPMARSPFSAAPPAPPVPGPAPGSLAAPPRPTGQPVGQFSGVGPSGLAQPAAGAPPVRGRDTGERRTLVVGRGISLQGVVQDAERLVVEGTVEATMIHAMELAISPGGVFKGEVEVEDAEVAGTIDGTLTARGNLIVRSTGRVLGTARCRRLQVEDGGQITGRMDMLTETPRPAAAAEPPSREAAE